MPISLTVLTYCNQAPPQHMVRRFDELGGNIGRAAGNDLVLEDASKYISRVHARIEFHDGGYYLLDVGSNPSLVNDRPLGTGKQVRLTDGDRVNIGEYQLAVSFEPNTAAPAPKPLPPSPLQVQPVPIPVPLPSLSGNPGDSLSGARILDVGGSLSSSGFDPLGLNLFDSPNSDPFAPPPQRASVPAFRGAESDHVSPEIAAFPVSAPVPAPATSAPIAIPDDYDPLSDYLPQRVAPPAPPFLPQAPVQQAPVQQAPPAPPTYPPASAIFGNPARVPASESPRHNEVPRLEPVSDVQRVSVEPVRSDVPEAAAAPIGIAPLAQTMVTTPVQAAPKPAAAMSGTSDSASDKGSNNAVILALMRGLGFTEFKSKRSAEETAELVGQMLREATNGTMSVLRARAMTKRESRVEMTMIASQSNNPLKFFPDADGALHQLLNDALAGYMQPVRAYKNAFEDLTAHELAVMAGMRAALTGVLQRFDPAAIEERLQVPTVMDKMLASNRKAKMWDRLVELYKQMTEEADEDFQRLFGEKFAEAYQEQTERLRQSRK